MASSLNIPKSHKWFLAGLAGAAALYLGKQYFNGGVCKVTSDLSGQIVLITGANTGIGYETAKKLAELKATVIIACRDVTRTIPAVEQIKKETGNQNVEFMRLDLSDLNSVKEFAKQFKAKYEKLNILINNAGIMALPERNLSKDGYELQFATNHIGHFYLTVLLLDLLKKAAPARVLNLSSRANFRGEMKWDDLMWERDYSPWAVYGQSKLANILFTKELNRRYEAEGIKSVAVHPGGVRTELGRHFKVGIKAFVYAIYPFFWFMSKSPLQGAQTTLQCALVDFKDLDGGKYFSDCKVTEPNPKANIEEDATRLWEVTERLISDKIENAFE